MRESNSVQRDNSTQPAAVRFRKKYRPLHFSHGIPRLARVLWPERTAAELSARAQTSERACRDILGRRAVFSGPSLIALLRSEEGIHFLEELMGDANPKWWKRARSAVKLGKVRAEIERARKTIAQLELNLADDWESA